MKKQQRPKKRNPVHEASTRQLIGVRRTTEHIEGGADDFGGVTLTEWDERVFVNADHFRLTRYTGDGHQMRQDGNAADWPHALAMAITEQRAGNRVIVYAVSASGRSVVCQPERWLELSNLYDAHVAASKGS